MDSARIKLESDAIGLGSPIVASGRLEQANPESHQKLGGFEKVFR